MKLVLHYLKYDFLRWRWLVFLLWVLCVVHAVLMGVLAGQGTWTRASSRMEDCVQIGAFGLICAAVTLCALAGGADSPVARRTWIMTRPRHARALTGARCLLLLAGVVLPMLASQAVVLMAMKFNAATVTGELLRVAGILTAAAAVCALWALARPCVSGVAFGVVCGAVPVGVFYLLTVKSHYPLYYGNGDPSALTVLLLLLIPSLAGLRGVFRPQTSRQRDLNAALMGLLTVAALAAILPLQAWQRYQPPPGTPAESTLAKSEIWTVRANNSRGQRKPGADASQDSWSFSLLELTGPGGHRLAGAAPVSVSWRQHPGAAWSSWIPASPDSRFNSNAGRSDSTSWWLELTFPRQALPALTDAELRVCLAASFITPDNNEIPLRAGELVQGNGWNFEITGVESRADGGIQWRGLRRAVPGALMPELGAQMIFRNGEGSSGRDGWGVSSHGSTFRSLPLLNFIYADEAIYRQGSEKESPAPLAPADFHLRLTRRDLPVEQDFIILLLSKITLPAAAPVQPASPQPTPSLPQRTITGPLFRPRPLCVEAEPLVPGKSATEREMARYLDYLTVTHWDYRAGPWGWPAEKAASFAALVPKWLPLFLEASVQHGEEQGAVLAGALTAGTPEERRGELLRRIPESPVLAQVAVTRGWQEEARPFILALVNATGSIPERLEPAIRRYRDPAFHAVLRGSFKASLADIRYWQSMPDLAPDLPQLLAAVRERLRGMDNPNVVSAGEVQGLLSTGDPVALDVLLRCLRNNPNGNYWPGDYLRRWVRTSDEKSVSFGNYKEAAAWVGATTAAGYTWQAARGYFVRKPVPPQP